jgi:hypothetical protein
MKNILSWELSLKSIFSYPKKLLVVLLSIINFSLFPLLTVTSQSLGKGFYDHGVVSQFSTQRGAVATVDGNGRDVVLVWMFDHRGSYGLLMIDAETGKTDEFTLPFSADYAVFSSLLSSKNKFYTLFNKNFVEFDPVKRAITFRKEINHLMAMGMTEDDKGVIWAATYPNSGLVSFNPETRDLKNYGFLYRQNWNQYQPYVAADKSGWIYFGIGNTSSQIIAFNPSSAKPKPMLKEPERKKGQAYVYRDLNGKVYGQSVKQTDETWYEFYKGKMHKIDKNDHPNPKPIITGNQALNYKDFPDGKTIKNLDLEGHKLVITDPKTKTEKTVTFDYTGDGAKIMNVAVSPDSTITGGTTFPMRFFSYNPKTGKIVNNEAFGQYDAVASQGNCFYIGVYPQGALLEWNSSKPWINTKKGTDTNPLLLATSDIPLHRPLRVLAIPDGKTIVMSGSPAYGYTGGGLLFWDREKKAATVLTDSAVILNQSTLSLVTLPGNKILGGTTTSPGTGGEAKATTAELYIMDLQTKKIDWHGAIMPGVHSYSDLCLTQEGLVYGIAELKIFFVFDPVKRIIIHQQDLQANFSTSINNQTTRVFVVDSKHEVYILSINDIFRVEPKSFKIDVISKTPVPIIEGGDYLDGLIYFVSGSHLYSYSLLNNN